MQDFILRMVTRTIVHFCVDGQCYFSFTSEEFVDIAYVGQPTLLDQMKTAVAQCPTFTNSSACMDFTP